MMFTFLFEMILDNRRDVAIAIAINLGIYAWVVASFGPSPLSGLDYYAHPILAMLTTYTAHLIIIGVTIYS